MTRFSLTSTLAGAAALALLAGPALAQTAYSDDSDFIMKASVGNTFEVESSQLALKSSQNPKIKSFAETMITDHTKAEKALMMAAKRDDMSTKMMLDDAHKSVMDGLKGKTGKDFDKAYVDAQVKAHDDTVGLLTDYEGSGKAEPLKMWATKTLPTVKMHQQHIAEINQMMPMN